MGPSSPNTEVLSIATLAEDVHPGIVEVRSVQLTLAGATTQALLVKRATPE